MREDRTGGRSYPGDRCPCRARLTAVPWKQLEFTSTGPARGDAPSLAPLSVSQPKLSALGGMSESLRPACCYQELKSPKPRLGLFLAVGKVAVLVEGSSSAARFVAAGLMYLPTPWRYI